jgi:large subunit ribosomal protein L21
MFAVVRTGGKQYKVAENDIITVERLTAKSGAKVTLDEVLMLGTGADITLGSPVVAGATVRAEILDQVRGDTILVFKKKRRKGYRRTRGHRQDLTVLRITAIEAPGAANKPAKAKAAKKPVKAEAKPAQAKPKTKAAKPAKAAAAKTKEKD